MGSKVERARLQTHSTSWSVRMAEHGPAAMDSFLLPHIAPGKVWLHVRSDFSEKPQKCLQESPFPPSKATGILYDI